MLTFESDYTEGTHPQILRRLAETNMEQLSGYGFDRYTKRAGEKIKAACACPEAEVYLLTGGTQTNALIITTMLKPYEGVVAAASGHVAVHESGAIEHQGHKVLTLPEHRGKLDAGELETYLADFYADGNHHQMVYPGMVYISHPTEYGTIYKKSELEAIAAVCRAHDIPLYLDGARLAYGLRSREADVTLADIARLCDVFYIGGTKVGALCGEAVVFTRHNMPEHFITLVKQGGALLAKGRLLGVQFDTLFTEDLYGRLGQNAIDRAEQLKELFREKGYKFLLESPTNQQFVILENGDMKRLSERVGFSFWEKVDDTHTAVRFATSWATTEENIRELEKIL